MSTPPPPPQGAFSLFPNTSPGRPRNSSRTRPEPRDGARSITPQDRQRSPTPQQRTSPPTSPPRTTRPRVPAIDTSVGRLNRPNPPPPAPPAPPAHPTNLPVQQPRTAADAPPRAGTAFSEANTLVHSDSVRTRRSLERHTATEPSQPRAQAQTPAYVPAPASSNLPPTNPTPQPHLQFSSTASAPPQQSSAPVPQPLRSIFPQYNPDIPLAQQQYFPTQTSPRHIPRHVINKSSMPALRIEPRSDNNLQATAGPSNAANAPVHDPNESSRWRRRVNDQNTPPRNPTVSSTASLKGLWKAANGWRAPASEGRIYCLALTQEKDAPIYTLSSASQPFYNLRVDPTSVSAKVTLRRYDPSKPYRPNTQNPALINTPVIPRAASSSGTSIINGITGGGSQRPTDGKKHWQEVLCTALEEPARRHAPQDGLITILYPSAACRAALDKPDDMHTVALAERECARLVWDDDSDSHFLVHPALATPFCVAIERTPTWSRVTYTLEHPESPQHNIAKLTRDGTGGGWLEIDTRLASHIDAFYAIDVAVSALLIVAAADESFRTVETFEPPPMVMFPPPAVFADGGEGRRGSRRWSLRRDKDRESGEESRRGRAKMEEFEIDVESRASSFFPKGEDSGRRSRRRRSGGSSSGMDGWPIWARCMVGSVTMALKCVLWCITMMFRAIARCFGVK